MQTVALGVLNQCGRRVKTHGLIVQDRGGESGHDGLEMIGRCVRGALGKKADDDGAIGAMAEGAVERHEHGGRTGIGVLSLKVGDVDAEQVLRGERLSVRFDGRKPSARAQCIDDLRLQQRWRFLDPARVSVVVEARAGSYDADARADQSW